MSDRDTIAAISTPPGPGAIGVVRISGPEAVRTGLRIFTPLKGTWPEGPSHRLAVVGHVHPPEDPASPIDQAVWLLFAGPRSFTGEDTVEITTHGGTLILAELLEAATRAGARMAEPGEFTRRAFMNGRLDLSQAEAVASLIFARTSRARRVMLRQVEGSMGRETASIRRDLLEVKTVLEAAIDFPEDVEVETAGLTEPLRRVEETVRRLLGTSRQGIALGEGLKAVIVGAPNVGKSSLLNALVEEERAIVHEVAGTTRDFIEGHISVEGIPMVVVDTAGLRGVVDSVEAEGIRRTRQLMEQADILLVVLDGSRGLGEDEALLLKETEGLARVVIANKNDLPAARKGGLPEGAIPASAKTGEGMQEVRRAVRDACAGGIPDLEEGLGVVTSLRQAISLEKVREGCRRALDGLGEGRGAELLSVDIDEALLGVGELTGEITTEEVINGIFERFCIGK